MKRRLLLLLLSLCFIGVVVQTDAKNTNFRSNQVYVYNTGARVGATSGWNVNATANLQHFSIPASQTSSTLVIPISGLKRGWTITGFSIFGNVTSAGNTATFVADLRKETATITTNADASVSSKTVAYTASAAINQSKTGLAEDIGAGESFYLLVTGTTASSTSADILGATVTVVER